MYCNCLLEHDGIFEDSKAMEHKCKSSKHPLVVRVYNAEWNDEQNKNDGQVIQHVPPVQKVLRENILHSAEKEKIIIILFKCGT